MRNRLLPALGLCMSRPSRPRSQVELSPHGDVLQDSVEGPERMVGTDAVLTQRYSGVPDNADTIIRALSPAADEDGLLLRTGVEGAGAARG